MNRRDNRNFAVGGATIALVLGLAISALSLGVDRPLIHLADRDAVQMAADIAVDDGESLDEERALKAAVFVGRIIDRDGEIDIGEGGFPFIVPIFEVDVVTALKGAAQGRARLAVTQIGAPDEFGGNAVTIGERYLFAAEGPDQGLFWIDEGLGSLRISSDDEAAALVTYYEELIRQVEQMPTPTPDIDPCQSLTGDPKIDIDPNEGRAGRTVRVTAKKVAGPMVLVYWKNHNNRVGKEEVRADCTASIQIKVPRDANPGRYDIIIVDARDRDASERFHVTD